VSRPKSRWDGGSKKLMNFKKNGVVTNSFSGKTMENPKRNNKAGLRKLDRRSGSRLRVGKVLAPHNARPGTVPF